MSKKLFAALPLAALLGVVLGRWADPAAHAQSSPSPVAFDWVTVGDPGNACDPQGAGRCFGSVGYAYRISRHEVTNAQYAAFLNAKAAADPLGLYNPAMATGGIARSGTSGSYTYSVVPGGGSRPVANVSFFDALRFANWLHNGQGAGDTETGAYTLLGGTPTPSNPMVQRNAGATVFLPTDAEWYKAAYYDTSLAVFYDYPAGTDAVIVCSAPTPAPNTANCGGAAGGAHAGRELPQLAQPQRHPRPGGQRVRVGRRGRRHPREPVHPRRFRRLHGGPTPRSDPGVRRSVVREQRVGLPGRDRG